MPPTSPDPGVGACGNNLALKVADLKMYFPVTKGLLRRKVADIKAADGVSFDIGRGETLGLVGESGCGKTTVGRCVIRLYEPTSGAILFEGEDIAKLPESRLRPLRRKIAIVLQDPASSLDPRQSIGKIVEEPLRTHHLAGNKAGRRERVAELFEMVGLDPRLMERYPHELSGGQRQRVAIARSLGGDPSLIVCDEAVSALDVSIQAQIINLLRELQEKIAAERRAICERCADRAELRRDVRPQGEAFVRPVLIGRCPQCGYRPCCDEPAIEGSCPRCGTDLTLMGQSSPS